MRLIAGVATRAVSRSSARSEVMRALLSRAAARESIVPGSPPVLPGIGVDPGEDVEHHFEDSAVLRQGSQMPGPDRLQVERQVAARREQLGRVMAQAITVCFWPRPGCAATP